MHHNQNKYRRANPILIALNRQPSSSSTSSSTMSSKGGAPTDDSDLEDLISKRSTPVGKPGNNVEIDIDCPSGYTSSSPGMNPCFCITSICQLCCHKFPCLSKCFYMLLLFSFLAFLSYTVFSPTQKIFGVMGADYSAITSAYDLSLSKVDHWCIQGDNDSCKCEDPLEPNPRSEFKSWNAAHKANVADVNLYRANYGDAPSTIDEATGKARPEIDVAFLGESVVEAMDGRWLGKRVVRAINTANDGKEGPEKAKRPDIGKVFERLFRKEKGGPVEGVALGIAGDNTANVLWRLQHDEMPYDFNPKVWWLVLGMNDLTRMQCSEEIVVLGILRVVEEIRLRKPDAKIVINSLLPMINYQRPGSPKMADFADFKNDKGDKMRESMEIDSAMRKFLGDKGPEKGGLNGDGGAGERRKGFDEHGSNGGRKLKRKLRSHKKRKNKTTKKGRGRRGRDNDDDDDEDNATEGPALAEALDRREKILEAKDKHIRDKVFRDNEKYRPKKPISPFLPMIRKKVLPPVWPSVHLINDKLKEFCAKHESITFFDATPIFASDTGRGGHQLHNELISPRGHPSELGFAVWEGHIMGKLHKELVDKAEKQAKVLPQEEEDSEVDILSPETEVSEDVEDGDGDGAEHVSDGKENEPPKPPTQPSRDEPAEEEEDDEEEEEEEERVSTKNMRTKKEDEEEEDEDKRKSMKKVRMKKEPSEEEEDEEEDEKEMDSKSDKVSTKKMKTKKEPSEDEEEEEEEDEVDIKADKRVSTKKKPSLRKNEEQEGDDVYSDEEEQGDDDAEEEE